MTPRIALLTRISTALLVFVFVALTPLQGQDQPATTDTPGPIATDRPAVTNSSVVVPVGSLQAENGFLETSSDGQSIVDGPETLVRLGIATKTELRLTVPDYYYNLGAASGTGFGDLAIGVKQQLGPTPGGFDVSAILFLSIPTGADGVSSGGYDPGLQVPWSRGLSAKWTVAGMLSLYWPTQGHTRNLTGESTILLDRQLTGPWDAFVEYAGDFPERGGSRHLLHFGTALKITEQQQLDFHFGVGLSPVSVNHFIGVGYSFRFQAFHRQ
jgi:Putative MetA-pathway of phenol degradation